MATVGPANLTSSIAHHKTDPLRNFKFQVSIIKDGFGVDMGFMSVSGLSITTEIIPYREGGMNTTTQKMPGQSDFSPLTLSKGVAVAPGGNANMNWMKELFAVMQGTGSRAAGAGDFRTTVYIKVLDHPVTKNDPKTSIQGGWVPVKALFTVYNAWPTSIAFSDFDAGANALMIQQMTLAHEGFDFLADSHYGMPGLRNVVPGRGRV
jgi:phage tail-like protein